MMLRTLLVVTCMLMLHASSQAALVYTFDQSDYLVAPGDTVDVQVFLTQTDTTSILTDEGLSSAGVRVEFDLNQPIDRAEVLSLSNIISNPAFDENDPLFTGSELVPGHSAGLFDGISFLGTPVVGNSVLLGTFTFTSGAIGGEVTNLRATDFSAFTETVSGVVGTPLDGMIGDGLATITVSAIPEPSSVAMIGAAAVLVCLRRRRAR